MDLGALYADHYGKAYSPTTPFAQAVCLFLMTEEVAEQVQYAAGLKHDSTTLEMVQHQHNVGSPKSSVVAVEHLFIPVANPTKRSQIESRLKLAEENDPKFSLSGNRDEPYDQTILDEIASAFNIKGLRYDVECQDYAFSLIEGIPFTSHKLTLVFK